MPEHRRQHRKWLRRFGYALGGLTVVVLVLAATVYIAQWREDSRLRQETRTQEGPVQGGDVIRDHALRLLAMLPPRGGLGDNAFRFVAVPELSYYSYAVSLSAKGAAVEGIVISTEKSHDGKKAATVRQNFTMSRNDYGALIIEMDHLADAYTGNNLQCLDGTLIAFERVRGPRVTSGIGNSCSKHYAAIGEIMRLTILRFVTPPGPPTGLGWYLNR